jgi:hypothetical protein
MVPPISRSASWRFPGCAATGAVLVATLGFMRKLIFLLVLAAACGDKPQAAQEGPPPDTAGGRPDLTRPDVGASVMVTLTDTAMVVSHESIELPRTSQMTFAVQNNSSKDGVFKIDGKARGKWSSQVPAGQPVLMSMIISRGEYQLLWPEDGSGQRKTLTVK